MDFSFLNLLYNSQNIFNDFDNNLFNNFENNNSFQELVNQVRNEGEIVEPQSVQAEPQNVQVELQEIGELINEPRNEEPVINGFENPVNIWAQNFVDQ